MPRPLRDHPLCLSLQMAAVPQVSQAGMAMPSALTLPQIVPAMGYSGVVGPSVRTHGTILPAVVTGAAVSLDRCLMFIRRLVSTSLSPTISLLSLLPTHSHPPSLFSLPFPSLSLSFSPSFHLSFLPLFPFLYLSPSSSSPSLTCILSRIRCSRQLPNTSQHQCTPTCLHWPSTHRTGLMQGSTTTSHSHTLTHTHFRIRLDWSGL